MTAQPGVTPNRRGLRSRELVLDAAERVMAQDGFEAATVARVVEVAGVPISSVYHYYGSKDGILLAVMERGAERFFADLALPDRRVGRSGEHLGRVVSAVVRALERHPSFLRLVVVFAVQPPRAGVGEVHAVVPRVREMALRRLRTQIGLAFGDDPRAATTDRLARFALAAVDGAFVASQTDDALTLERLLEPLPAALAAARRELRRPAPRR
jgi:AcrR family transcriptional regulator